MVLLCYKVFCCRKMSILATFLSHSISNTYGNVTTIRRTTQCVISSCLLKGSAFLHSYTLTQQPTVACAVLPPAARIAMHRVNQFNMEAAADSSNTERRMYESVIVKKHSTNLCCCVTNRKESCQESCRVWLRCILNSTESVMVQ